MSTENVLATPVNSNESNHDFLLNRFNTNTDALTVHNLDSMNPTSDIFDGEFSSDMPEHFSVSSPSPVLTNNSKPPSKILQSLRSMDNQKQQTSSLFSVGNGRQFEQDYNDNLMKLNNMAIADHPESIASIWADYNNTPVTTPLWEAKLVNDQEQIAPKLANPTWPSVLNPFSNDAPEASDSYFEEHAAALNLDTSFQSDDSEYLWNRDKHLQKPEYAMHSVSASAFGSSSLSEMPRIQSQKTYPGRYSGDAISPLSGSGGVLSNSSSSAVLRNGELISPIGRGSCNSRFVGIPDAPPDQSTLWQTSVNNRDQEYNGASLYASNSYAMPRPLLYDEPQLPPEAPPPGFGPSNGYTHEVAMNLREPPPQIQYPMPSRNGMCYPNGHVNNTGANFAYTNNMPYKTLDQYPPLTASRPSEMPMTFATVVANGCQYRNPYTTVAPGTNGQVSVVQSTPPVHRNHLLDDLRQAATNSGSLARLQQQIKLRDVAGSVVEFARDQHGSRLIQQKLEHASETDKNMVFEEILPESNKLMTDVFGNYVIQKFFEFGSMAQKQRLMSSLLGHVIELATQMYGCRVIQKALEAIDENSKQAVVQELYPHVMRCVKDQNGNHVIQKCIECVSPEKLRFIVDAFKSQVVVLSKHPYGCRVIQRILEHCLPEQTHSILAEIHSGVDELVRDQYGNYVIQHVLENGGREDKRKIVLALKNKVAELSMHKFASNVMERAIHFSSKEDKAALMAEILEQDESQSGGSPESCTLLALMKDQYANYVIQRMIELGPDPQRRQLLDRIKSMQSTLKRFNYGKHILTKLDSYKPDGPRS